jgi:hypothetical protein
MYITSLEWLDVVHKEYLRDFISRGGAAVKFVVPSDGDVSNLRDDLCKMAKEENFLFAFVDSASTKIHMIDKLFHEVARQIDWDELAYRFLLSILSENGIQVPEERKDFTLHQIALLNELEEMLLRNDIKRWLQRRIFKDYEMSQEFRIAMIRLCMAQLDPAEDGSFLSNAIKEWLRGELRLISAVKEALIFQKIARHNARHMLFSLAHWLKVIGMNGLVLTLDIHRYTMIPPRPRYADDGLYFSVAATLDMYEVLRQFIDGTDELEHCLITVFATKKFLNDEQRSFDRYNPLKMRICDEVRDKHRQNPFAPLIRISG